MTPEMPSRPVEHPSIPPTQETLTDQQVDDLAEPKKQADYLRAYAEQLRRRACPGCGSDGLPF